jgi:hypothetical protein
MAEGESTAPCYFAESQDSGLEDIKRCPIMIMASEVASTGNFRGVKGFGSAIYDGVFN